MVTQIQREANLPVCNTTAHLPLRHRAETPAVLRRQRAEVLVKSFSRQRCNAMTQETGETPVPETVFCRRQTPCWPGRLHSHRY
jgi:hypothetical protein